MTNPSPRDVIARWVQESPAFSTEWYEQADDLLEALRSRGYAVTRIEDEALRACSASPREKLVAAALRAKCLEIFGSTWSNDAAVQLARAALDVVDE
jgi:ferric-dicitrate binding protein FerR (iron transport regulator)